MYSFNKFCFCLILIIAFFIPSNLAFSDNNIVDQVPEDLLENSDTNVIIKDYNQLEADKSVIKIIEKNTLRTRVRTAFPVGDNFIVTSSFKNPNGDYFIRYNEKEISAIFQKTDASGRISLFRIPNIDFHIPQISLEHVGSNRQVHIHYFARENSSKPFNSHGKFQKLINSELYGPDSYLHNLDDFLDNEAIGAPIFNNCGEIIGMNIKKDSSFSEIPTQFIALGHQAIIKFLNNQGIDFSQSETKCLSEQKKREFLDQVKVKKEAEAQKAEEEAKKADEERIAANVAKEKAERKQLEAEEERLKKEETNKNLIIASIASAIFFTILVIFLLRNISKRKRELNIVKDTIAAHEAIKGEEGPDFILRGSDLTIKIPGDKLGTEQGVILGRNTSEADVILDKSEISRSHLRLFIKDKIIYADDLGSANGTILNGARLSAGRPMSIHNGDEITLAGIIFTVQGL